MNDGISQFADGRHWVNPIPEQMAGIEVGAERWSAGFAHAEQGLNVVDQHAGMHFDADLDIMLFGNFRRPTPVGNANLIPLVIEDLEEVRWPGAGHPVGAGVARRASRQARENVHRRGTQPFGQFNRLAKDRVGFLVHFLVRADRVPVTTQGADDHPPRLNRLEVSLDLFLADQQFIHRAVMTAGKSTGADLYGSCAGRNDFVERLLKGKF